MIPILFTKTESEFLTNGLGRLAGCISCIVTEERNGIFECEFQYPINGVHYSEIQMGRLVYVTHDDTKEPQPFEIYRRSAEINGIVTFNAHHISYRLSEVTVRPFTAGSCAAALNGIADNSINLNPFTFWTDKNTVANFKSDKPRNARNMLGGEENSILDVFGGGDYEFDKFTVKLHAQRGVDSGVVIAYSKNMTDLTAEESLEGVYNAIIPFWADTEGNLVMLPEEMIIYSGLEPIIDFLTDHNGVIIRTHNGDPIEVAYEMVQAVPMDLSDAFEEAPTVAQLRAAAQARFERSQAWLPNETIDVDFVHLWQTEEYKDYAALQRVRLCDTVSVYYKKLGVEAVKKKVVRTVYNVLLDRYDSIELGTPSVSLSQAIERSILEAVPTTSMMEDAIKYASDMIRGGLGGYVVMTPGPNGYPQEILIMDTPDINTAVNVWRFNQGGLGHSSNGYEGPYSDIALTQDGRINASLITTGILNANIIRAGILSDINGNASWNLSTGVLIMTKGSINLGAGNFVVTDAGSVTAKSGIIGPFTMNSNGFTYKTSSSLMNVTYGNITNTQRINWQAGGSSVFGTQLAEGDLNFVGRAGATDPASYAGLFSIGLSELNDGTIYLSIEKYNAASNERFIDFYNSGTYKIQVGQNVWAAGNVEVGGTKSRRVDTDNYSKRLHYCYETPTPLFGDIGEATLDEEGLCYVDLDDIFSETIAERVEYQVFLQEEGEGSCYIAEKTPRYFVIKGTPNLRVAWELKAKQKDYQNIRLEQANMELDEYETNMDDYSFESYINEQEELLYGIY